MSLTNDPLTYTITWTNPKNIFYELLLAENEMEVLSSECVLTTLQPKFRIASK